MRIKGVSVMPKILEKSVLEILLLMVLLQYLLELRGVTVRQVVRETGREELRFVYLSETN